MNELFNVTTNGDKLTLSARELHKELNIAGRFSRWFDKNYKDNKSDWQRSDLFH